MSPQEHITELINGGNTIIRSWLLASVDHLNSVELLPQLPTKKEKKKNTKNKKQKIKLVSINAP